METNTLSSNDINPTAELLVEYWRERGMEHSQEWAEKYIKEGHAKDIKTDQFIVIRKDAKLSGCVSIVIYEGDVAEIRDLVVKEECRSQGCGTKLLESAISFSNDNNVRKVFALVSPRIQQFFKKRGFDEEGTLKSHFSDGEDLIIMSRFLK